MKYNEDIIADGIFYSAPKFIYQVFITRTYINYIYCFYTTSFLILKIKNKLLYETLFEEKKMLLSIAIILLQKIFIVISKKVYIMQQKKIFPNNINIKYCIWHVKKTLKFKKKRIML